MIINYLSDIILLSKGIKFMTEWNLKEIYINDEAWSKDLEILKKKINEISKFKGHLKTEQEINDFFVFQDDLGKLFEKLYSYVAMNYDKNQKDIVGNSVELFNGSLLVFWYSTYQKRYEKCIRRYRSDGDERNERAFAWYK